LADLEQRFLPRLTVAEAADVASGAHGNGAGLKMDDALIGDAAPAANNGSNGAVSSSIPDLEG
jgi:hypothetical protein